LTVGYRRFQLGTVGTTSRNETQYLYSFTIANFGNVGDIRRSNSVFRDPTLPPSTETRMPGVAGQPNQPLIAFPLRLRQLLWGLGRVSHGCLATVGVSL